MNVNQQSDSPTPVETAVISKNNGCKTADAKWLCLKNIYHKFCRPYTYDLGETIYNNKTEFWFNFCTDFMGDVYLLHLYVTSHEKKDFSLAVSDQNYLQTDKKSNIVYLPPFFRTFEFKNIERHSSVYLTTYEFSKIDVELLNNDKSMYIPISFTNVLPEVATDVMIDHHFGSLLNDSFDTDFTVESEDGTQFKVHKCILSAGSDVFKAMFQFDTLENKNNYVKLADQTTDDIKYLLEFIYTGTITEHKELSANLMVLADMYNVEGCKILTEESLVQQLSLENALYILVMADSCNAQIARSGAVKYILKHPSVVLDVDLQEYNDFPVILQLRHVVELKNNGESITDKLNAILL